MQHARAERIAGARRLHRAAQQEGRDENRRFAVTAAAAGYLEKIQQQELTIRQQQTQITEMSKRIAQMEDTISKAAAILGREIK